MSNEKPMDQHAEMAAVTGVIPHRDTPVKCAACGKRVQRKGRTQKYCSRRCRQRDYWGRRALAKISAVVTHDTGRSTTPDKSPSNINGLRRPKSQSSFGRAPLNLVGGGSWRWPGAVTLDPAVREKIMRIEIGDRFVLVQPATSTTTMSSPTVKHHAYSTTEDHVGAFLSRHEAARAIPTTGGA